MKVDLSWWTRKQILFVQSTDDNWQGLCTVWVMSGWEIQSLQKLLLQGDSLTEVDYNKISHWEFQRVTAPA